MGGTTYSTPYESIIISGDTFFIILPMPLPHLRRTTSSLTTYHLVQRPTRVALTLAAAVPSSLVGLSVKTGGSRLHVHICIQIHPHFGFRAEEGIIIVYAIIRARSTAVAHSPPSIGTVYARTSPPSPPPVMDPSLICTSHP